MPVTAREASLNSLEAFRKRNARPDVILNSIVSKSNMDKRDVALASNIVNGVLQNEALLDYYITFYSGRSLDYFEGVVLDILRISAYQLIFLDRVPAHAAVSEGVSLAKKYSRGASGLVNAVLRKISNERDKLPPIVANSEIQRLSITYSHPIWLIKALINDYGLPETERIMAADNVSAPVTVIVNTLKVTEKELMVTFEMDGASVSEHPVLNNALYVSSAGDLSSLKSFKEGLFYVQDCAAYMAVLAAEPKPGDTVLDACAAPGGKSFASAIVMKNNGSIVSCDIHEKKLRLVSQGAERLGISIIKTLVHDGKSPFQDYDKFFDLVITDVPCSGTGVIRSKPDIRYKDESTTERLPEVQSQILFNASRAVKAGGTLLYSTCTLLKRENERVIEQFLRENDDFYLCEFELPAPFGHFDGMATILPNVCNTDGFFICKMKRKR